MDTTPAARRRLPCYLPNFSRPIVARMWHHILNISVSSLSSFPSAAPRFLLSDHHYLKQHGVIIPILFHFYSSASSMLSDHHYSKQHRKHCAQLEVLCSSVPQFHFVSNASASRITATHAVLSTASPSMVFPPPLSAATSFLRVSLYILHR